jgi:molybdate transport system substrate-binding protein
LSSCLLGLFAFAIPAKAAEILVAAASDIARLEKPLSEGYQKVGGVPARFVFGSSGMLTRQIENGAPYDVFLSANEKFVQDLAAQGKLDRGTACVYALGRLALWSKSGRFKTLAGLREASRLALANPAHAPYGIGARQALERQGIWPEMERRIVYAENVRQALQYAESGNVDAALTAWSLVFDRGGVLVPADMHEPIRQAAGRVVSSANQAQALQFLEFLAGKAGRDILSRHGLFPPD